MNLHQLRLLREVAGRGTIAAAADALGYTPSAVSQQLTALEKSTGIAVLERIGRTVQLTEAGQELVEHADDLLARLEAAQAAMEKRRTEPRGSLTVSIFESVASTLVVPLMDRLAELHPELQIRTRQMDPDLAVESLEAGDLDLAFVLDYPHAPAPRRRGLILWPLVVDTYHVVVADSDPIGQRVALAELSDRAFIASPPGMSCGRCFLAACRAAGFEPELAHALDDYHTTLRLVAAGRGTAIIPDLGLTELPAGVRVVELDPPLRRIVQLGSRTASADRPSVAAFKETARQVAAELGLASPATADLSV